MTFHWHCAHSDDRSITDRVADAVASVGCSFPAFVLACAVVVVWGVTGPYFNYSDSWQLIINTGTTIVTFLMAFLIGSNQMRQAERDRHHADADYATNLAAKQEIEALAVHLNRIEVEKLDALNAKVDRLIAAMGGPT